MSAESDRPSSGESEPHPRRDAASSSSGSSAASGRSAGAGGRQNRSQGRPAGSGGAGDGRSDRKPSSGDSGRKPSSRGAGDGRSDRKPYGLDSGRKPSRGDAERRPDNRTGERTGASSERGRPPSDRAAGAPRSSERRDGGRPGSSGRPVRSGGRPADDRASGGDRGPRPDRGARERPDRPPEPMIAEDATWDQLDRAARARLRTLSKANAEQVGGHLVMAGRLIEDDPELAYEHAQAAVRRAGRVDVVREAAALAAYATGRYAEALRELRTVRRLSGVDAHRAIEADCERGLGRPDRALALVAGVPAGLSADEQAELAIVASGARLDLGEPEAALSALERAAVPGQSSETRERLAEATQAVLVALGRASAQEDPAAAVGSAGESADGSDEEVVDDDVLEIDDLLDRP
jgi:hypothetical protein